LVVFLQATSFASQAEKKQRSFDKIIDEWKRKVADLQEELEKAQRESRGVSAEVYKLRAQLEESTDAIEAVRRDNKNLSGSGLSRINKKISRLFRSQKGSLGLPLFTHKHKLEEKKKRVYSLN